MFIGDRFDDDAFTVRLVGPPHLIAVDTLIETLRGFSDALKEINAVVNPGYELEIFVDSLKPGSVNIGVKLKKHIRKHVGKYAFGILALATPTDVKHVVLEVLADFISAKLASPTKPCDVAVNLSEGTVNVEGDNCNVHISQAAQHAKQAVASNQKVAAGVRRAIRAAEKDSVVESVGVVGSGTHPPAVQVPRARFADLNRDLKPKTTVHLATPMMRERVIELVPGSRLTTERAHLIVIKAIFKRGKRRWQFNWSGIKISAPITDPYFFDQMEGGSIALSQGDALDADLAITQKYIEAANVWENVGYEVAKVYSVAKGPRQISMDASLQ